MAGKIRTFLCVMVAIISITPNITHANGLEASKEEVDRYCQHAERNATPRLRKQINNYKFAYDLHRVLTEKPGRHALHPELKNAKKALLEVCSFGWVYPS